MCGIFSWSGLKPGVFNKAKLDLIGIINETRGKHSCGVAVDGDIFIGVEKQKVYRDFIANKDIPLPKRYPVVLGHTRHATVGAHTIDNAHPFGFGTVKTGESKGDYAFIGVHNGSLLNHKELAKNYGINEKTKSSSGNWKRDKIDSEILLEILYKTKNFKVLSDYKGAAALKWYFSEDPDTVYYYHGKSPKQKGDEPTEERPLYYYKESRNSLYVSSIEDSLRYIGGRDETIGEFEHNVVYVVKNGDIDSAKKYRIARKGSFQKHGTSGRKSASTSSSSASTSKGASSNSSKDSQNCRLSNKNNKSFDETCNIYDETTVKDINKYGGRVYFNKFRYWRNGHRINGFWTYVAGYGYHFLGEKLKHAEESFWRLVGKVFIKGEFKAFNEVSDEELNLGWIPFKNTKENPITSPQIYIFYDGIRIESPQDLQGCLNMESIGRAFDIQSLSIPAKHPIIDLTYSSRDNSSQAIYFQGELCTDTVTPLGSDRAYTIKGGNLIGYEDLKVEEEEVTDLISEVEKMAKAKETEFLENEAKGTSSYVEDDFMENYLQKVFDNPLQQLKAHKRQLETYLPHMGAKRGLRIIDNFENAVHNLLELEEKE